MASYRGIWRACLWRCVCLCLLFSAVTTEAATRVPVPVPSSSEVVNGSGAASVSGDRVRIPGEPGVEYIPRTPNGTPRVPVKVIPTIDYSIPRTLKAVGTRMRGGAAALVGSVLVGLALDQIGALIDEAGKPIRKHLDVPPGTIKGEYWKFSGSGKYPANTGFTPESVCPGKITGGSDSSGVYFCLLPAPDSYTVAVNKDICLGGIWYNPGTKVCDAAFTPNGYTSPFGESDFADFDAALSSKIPGANPDWIKDLLRRACEGSPSPNACLDSLMDQSRITGPASVSGGTQTTTTTYTKPDGTTGTKTSEAKTTYNLTYGPNYFDYSKSVVTTNYQDGQKTDETTQTENPDATAEEPPEEEKPTADPCTGTCDGPKYEDLYKPTDETKEDALDSYASRVSSIPIINAASGFFSVSVSASCPIWQTSVDFSVMGHQFNDDLRFDYHCQPWFTDYRPFAIAVVMIIAALGAFWVATLD